MGAWLVDYGGAYTHLVQPPEHTGPAAMVTVRAAAKIALHLLRVLELACAIPSASARTTIGTRNKVVRKVSGYWPRAATPSVIGTGRSTINPRAGALLTRLTAPT